jgi:hypothetical protein
VDPAHRRRRLGKANPCSSKDVKAAKWAHLAHQAQKPVKRPGIEQAADEIVIRNTDGEVRATWSILVQERARGVALYVKADDIVYIGHSEIDGSMEVTLREHEVKALADWLTKWQRENRPRPLARLWQRIRTPGNR